ncbi:MAG: sensor histidine kinase [Ruminococcus sp.]|jgi:signal transduction histidine kinase
MTSAEILCLILGILLAAAVFWGIWERFQVKKIYDRLDRMLEEAMAGKMQERTFDESLQSRLEERLYHFIRMTGMSAEKKAEERDKISRLIGDISHQTKTPVANSLLYAELLLEQPLTKEGDECARALYFQVKKLDFLIHSLVKTSRLENGIVALSPRKESVSRLLKEVEIQMEDKAEKEGIFLEWEEPVQEAGEENTACFDLKWTQEALCNILDNGIKYSEPGGRIWISCQWYPMFLRIDVKDQGIGIREGEIPKIFGRFYRSPDAAEKEGVGIGLYLARDIVRRQGGYIRVRSRYGEGSVFSVYLPREKKKSAPA